MEKTYRIFERFIVRTYDEKDNVVHEYDRIENYGPMTTESEAIAYIEGKVKGIKPTPEDAPLPGA